MLQMISGDFQKSSRYLQIIPSDHDLGASSASTKARRVLHLAWIPAKAIKSWDAAQPNSTGYWVGGGRGGIESPGSSGSTA